MGRAPDIKSLASLGVKLISASTKYRFITLLINSLHAKPEELHGVIQTELYADESKNAKILTYAQEHHVNYRFVPGNTELFVGNIEVDLFRSSIPVIEVHQTALFGWGRVLKRLSDLFLGGSGTAGSRAIHDPDRPYHEDPGAAFTCPVQAPATRPFRQHHTDL